jgi:hypothetical protein
VGNPPFLGNKKLKEEFGDGYVTALHEAYGDVDDTVDLVMYWWHRAALEVRNKRAKRFGLITTNSIKQVRQRGVINHHRGKTEGLPPLKLLWAVPDHPWGGTRANVRIAMTVGGLDGKPWLGYVKTEGAGDTPEARADSVKVDGRFVEVINSDLSTGTNINHTNALASNSKLCSPGVKLHGNGFQVSKQKWEWWGHPGVVHPYMNGRDLVERSRNMYVIDLFGLEESEVKKAYPQIYQHLLETVKPERDQNNRPSYKNNWWIFGEPRANLRPALKVLTRFIVTVVTTKHRVFTFLDGHILPDDMLIVVATDDAYHLGVLSSKIHKIWVTAKCSYLGKGPRYIKTVCFDPFPFPDPPELLKEKIRSLGEELDSHVKDAQKRGLTITEIYNLVELIKSGAALTPAQRLLHEKALTTLLTEIHDKLDSAVAEGYGWPTDITDSEVLDRLVSLNRERAEEEAKGIIRYLRPDYQSELG